MANCKYKKHCEKADISLREFSRWPRDPAIYPLCRDEERARICLAYKMLEDNPEFRKQLEAGSHPNKTIAVTGLGDLGSMWLITLGSTLGVAGGAIMGAINTYFLAEGLSEKYGHKTLREWWNSIGYTEGIDRFYDQVVGRCQRREGKDEQNKTTKAFLSWLEKGIQIDGLDISIRDEVGLDVGGVSFSLGKLRASYPLTDDFALHVDKDFGVVGRYTYKVNTHPKCDDPEHDHDIDMEWMTGVFLPEASQDGSFRAHDGFIASPAGMMAATINLVPMGNSGQSIPEEVLEMSTEISGMIDDQDCSMLKEFAKAKYKCKKDKAETVFGRVGMFSEITEHMPENHRKKAREIHRLFQRILYSE